METEPPGGAHAGEAAAPPSDQERSRGGRLRAGVASGVRWGTFDQVAQTVLRMATTVLLSRLLDPRDFGLVAIALVVVNLAELLSGLGFGAALVHRKDLRREHVAVAFTLSGAFGFVLAGATALSAWPAAAFFDEADLRRILPVLGLVFVCKGLELTPNDMLRRSLLFGPYYVTSTVSTVVASGAGLAMAAAGLGVWSLVGLALVESALASALAWVVALRAGVWKPALSLERRAIRELLPYSSYVTASLFVAYGQVNGDNLLIGKVLGARPLGYYNLAYRVMFLPLQKFGQVLTATFVPALSAVSDDPPRLRAAYLRVNQYAALVFLPVTVGMAVTAPQAVPVLFGREWLPAVRPLQLLALGGAVISLNRLRGALWLAIGKPKWDLWLNVMALCLYIPGFAVGVQFGITWVALAFLVAATLEAPIVLMVVARGLGVGWIDVLRPLAPVVMATAAMAAGAAAAGRLMEGFGAEPVQLAVMVLAGAVVYLVALRLLAADAATEMLRDLARRGRRS